MQIQEHKKPLEEAVKGQAVAISIRGRVIIGRQVKEGDVLYVDVPLEHITILLEEFADQLSEEEVEILKRIRLLRMGLAEELPP